MDMPQSEMTKRVLKALAHPAVNVLAHPTGRLLNEREPFAIDLEQIFYAAKRNEVAIELNAQPDRLDLNDVHLLRARELGVKIAINTDAHNAEQLRFMQYGIDQARRGWLQKADVLNTMTCRDARELAQKTEKSIDQCPRQLNGVGTISYHLAESTRKRYDFQNHPTRQSVY